MKKNGVKRAAVLAATSAVLVSGHTVAEQDSTTEKMDDVQVWGTAVSASSISLKEDAIAIKQADHLSDLLRTVPGVDIGGAHSLNQRIHIRSMDDKDLEVSIDGAIQNSFMYHHMGNLQIHADILKSAEIEVGKNSVISGGLGGVARFKTKEAKDLLKQDQQVGGRAQISYADNAQQSYSATVYGQVSEQFDILAYYNAVERENYTVGGGKIKDENGDEVKDSEGNDTSGEVRGLEGDLSDALIKLGWDISDDQRLSIGYESYEDEGDYSYRPDMGLATDITIAERLDVDLIYPTEFTRETYTLGHEIHFGDHSVVETSLFRNESVFWRDERGLENWRPAFATVNEGTAENSGLRVLARTELGDHIVHALTYGFDYLKFETGFEIDGEYSSGEEAKSKAVFVQNAITIGGFTVTPGIRYDQYKIDAVSVDQSYSETSGALALEYRVNQSLAFRASSTQLFKGPELSEVFLSAGLNDTPTPDIKAETGTNNELGFSLNVPSVSMGLTLFETEVEDYIYSSRSIAKDNVGDMVIEGFETFVGYEYQTLSVLLSYSQAESDLQAFEEYEVIDGARLDRQQGDTTSLNIDYEWVDYNLAFHWDVNHVEDVDAKLDVDGTASLDNAKEEYTVHNISVRWEPKDKLEGLTVVFGIDNVFDEFYASQSSRTGVSSHPLFGDLYLLDYEPGRNFKTTVSYQF